MAAGQVASHAGVLVKLDGTPVAMTGEAMSQITGKYYRVTNAAKRCFDWRQDLTVIDDGVDVDAADIEHIDYLHGIVQFAGGYTVNGAVTVTGTYVPFTTLGVVQSADFEMSREMVGKTVFGNLFARYLGGLADFSVQIGAFDHLDSASGVETLEASFGSGTRRCVSIEIIQDGSTITNGGIAIRGLVVPPSTSTDAEPASIVESGTTLTGSPVESTNAAVSGSWPVSWSILDGADGRFI